jgi:hypothetical protein
MKRWLIGLAIIASLSNGVSYGEGAQDQTPRYAVRTLSLASNAAEVIKLDTRSGKCWRAKNDVWQEIPQPETLPPATYDFELIRNGESAWILVLVNEESGNVLLYSSVNGKWKSVKP